MLITLLAINITNIGCQFYIRYSQNFRVTTVSWWNIRFFNFGSLVTSMLMWKIHEVAQIVHDSEVAQIVHHACRCYGSALQYLNEDDTFRAPPHTHTPTHTEPFCSNDQCWGSDSGGVWLKGLPVPVHWLHGDVWFIGIHSSIAEIDCFHILAQIYQYCLSTVMVAGTEPVCVCLHVCVIGYFTAVTSEFTTTGYAANSDTASTS